MRTWISIATSIAANATNPTPFGTISAVTPAYNVAEAAIALWFGSDAESVVLVGFGLDSL